MPYNSPAQQRFGGKSKSTALILAIFFSFFTWLYTSKRDGKKFWLALIIYLVCLFTLFGSIYLYDVQTIILPAIWLWAVLSTAFRKSEWYAQY